MIAIDKYLDCVFLIIKNTQCRKSEIIERELQRRIFKITHKFRDNQYITNIKTFGIIIICICTDT